MIRLLVLLFICTSCTAAKYYKASELAIELKKNENQLAYLEDSVKADFSHKSAFYQSLSSQFPNKSAFVAQELKWRMRDMETRKKKILAQSSYIRSANTQLLQEIKDKKKISDRDPVFDQIEEFSESTREDAQELFKNFDAYRTASAEFSRFILFSKSTWQKSTKL